MIRINSNTIMTNKGITPLNRLTDDTINNINELKSLISTKFEIEFISSVFITNDSIITNNKGIQYTILNNEMNESQINLINKIKNLNN